jgi:hypothetical protein
LGDFVCVFPVDTFLKTYFSLLACFQQVNKIYSSNFGVKGPNFGVKGSNFGVKGSNLVVVRGSWSVVGCSKPEKNCPAKNANNAKTGLLLLNPGRQDRNSFSKIRFQNILFNIGKDRVIFSRSGDFDKFVELIEFRRVGRVGEFTGNTDGSSALSA